MKRYSCEQVSDSFIDQAPVRLLNSVRIDATPEQIWAALEDAETWPRWASVIRNVEWTSPLPRGVGTTRTVTMMGKMTGYEQFIAWEPYRRMSFRFDEATMNGVSAFAERYTLEVISADCTEVTWVMAMAPKGVSKMIVPLTQVPMRRMFGRMLRTFKTIVETEYAGARAG